MSGDWDVSLYAMPALAVIAQLRDGRGMCLFVSSVSEGGS